MPRSRRKTGPLARAPPTVLGAVTIMSSPPSPENELQGILQSLLRTGGAPRPVRRRLQDLLFQLPASEREAFLLRAFDQANAQLKDDARIVLKGVRKLVSACRE